METFSIVCVYLVVNPVVSYHGKSIEDTFDPAMETNADSSPIVVCVGSCVCRGVCNKVTDGYGVPAPSHVECSVGLAVDGLVQGVIVHCR